MDPTQAVRLSKNHSFSSSIGLMDSRDPATHCMDLWTKALSNRREFKGPYVYRNCRSPFMVVVFNSKNVIDKTLFALNPFLAHISSCDFNKSLSKLVSTK